MNLDKIFAEAGQVDSPQSTEETETIETSEVQPEAVQPQFEETPQETEGLPNLEDLPPELQAHYKSMQADYTRKTQQLAEDRRVMDQALEIAKGKEPAQQETQGVTPEQFWNPHADSEINVNELIEEEQQNAIRSMIWSELRSYLAPELNQYKQVIQDLYVSNQQTQLSTTLAQYPGAQEHLPAVKDFLGRNPNSTFEEALHAVSKGKLNTAPAPAPTPNGNPAPRRLQPEVPSLIGSKPVSQTKAATSKVNLADLIRSTQQTLGGETPW